ncbi:TRAP transporter small permease [Billgrantia montanilacus]|uniref:TRAP transporter small permease n=1 Tax=Billgrantia montanilacus TaxID=2282305 RepID=UPI0015F0048E|nr:TRAP transporter small permease [Halomonas montanilacus]
MSNKIQRNPMFYIDLLLKSCLVAMMIAIASLTFYQVVMRYGFNKSSSWSEEAIRFIFIWCSFLAIAMGVREKIHIGINIVVELFNKKVQLFIEIIGHLAIMAFSGHLIYYGWKVVLATRLQTSPALGIPMSWIYLSIPTMSALIFLFCLIEILKIKNNLKTVQKGT